MMRTAEENNSSTPDLTYPHPVALNAKSFSKESFLRATDQKETSAATTAIKPALQSYKEDTDRDASPDILDQETFQIDDTHPEVSSILQDCEEVSAFPDLNDVSLKSRYGKFLSRLEQFY